MASSTDFKEYKIVSAKSSLSHHLMKFNSAQYDLPSLGTKVKIYREPQVFYNAFINDANQQNGPTPGSIDGSNPQKSNEEFDVSKIAPGSNIPKVKAVTSNVKKRSKTFFIAREEGEEETDIHKYRGPTVDKKPWIISNADRSVVFEGKLETNGQNASYLLFMFSVNVFN